MKEYTNKEIEEMFNNRFVINITTYNKHTLNPTFNFRDRKYNESYSVDQCTRYSYRLYDRETFDHFKIRILTEIVNRDVEIRDQKIKIILDEY